MKRFLYIISSLSLIFTCIILIVTCSYLYAGESFTSSRASNEVYTEAHQRSIGFPDWPRPINPVHMVVVFTKFKGEAPGDTLAPKWADDLFSGNPGSVSHFFDSVSFGLFEVSGEYLPRRYELPQDSTAYVNDRDRYATDLLTVLNDDPAVNFRDFDNEGPDGIPGSSDDDHFVDYMVLMPMSRPYDFIFGYATGTMNIGLKSIFYTHDKSSDGFWIKLDKNSGCLATGNTKNGAVGTIVAELSHAYGTMDLMDTLWDDPESDSAGVGYWDFLGKGALGWDEHDGPMGPCAYHRMLLNSIGYNNSNLKDIFGGFHQGLRLKPSGNEDGVVYRIWISAREYFLLENRRNDSLYYDRFIPQNGMLIWHIQEGESNANELKKLCDLECADGRYLDAGYPLGKRDKPFTGGDNLDFWAHDLNYTILHEGNLGDMYDVYDGKRYVRFGPNTNPNTFSKVTLKSTSIDIFNIHPEGNEMVFDCIVPPFYNWFEEKFPFIGLAFHRFASVIVTSSSKPSIQDLYLLRYGYNYKPDDLVTVTGDSLTVESLEFLAEHEIAVEVAKRLLTNEQDLRSSNIIRRNVSVEEFEDIAKNFGANIEDVCSGRIPMGIQKVSRVSDIESLPVSIDLHQNYPNPFNARTTIAYVLPSSGKVALEVYNILGQQIMLVDQGFKEEGLHTMYLDAADLASGIYLYRLHGITCSQAKKFTIIR